MHDLGAMVARLQRSAILRSKTLCNRALEIKPLLPKSCFKAQLNFTEVLHGKSFEAQMALHYRVATFMPASG